MAIFYKRSWFINIALFWKTARQFREKNNELKWNMRDFATQEQLLILSNLEVLNSQFIKEWLLQKERLKKLNQAAIFQMTSLLKNKQIKNIKN